jgi:hypothetical protein
LSTLALEGTEAAAAAGSEAAPAPSGARPGVLLRYADLALLALALPLFVVAGWPLVGYAAAAGAWLAQHAILAFADRASVAALRRGERNRALGIIGITTLGRLWLVTMAILLVGLLGEREDGLAAAVLTFVLVTVHLGCLALTRLLHPQEDA